MSAAGPLDMLDVGELVQFLLEVAVRSALFFSPFVLMVLIPCLLSARRRPASQEED
jgi:hypothetical protein